MFRHSLAAVSAVVLVALAAGCSSTSDAAPIGTAAPAAATSSAPATTAAPPAAPTTDPKTAAPVVSAPTPDAVIVLFKSAKLPIKSVFEVTAANDPNHLLGRPSGYTAKAGWVDSRIAGTSCGNCDPNDVGWGGEIEQWPTPADAQARKTYIQGILKASPMYGSEYDDVVGDLLIRISGQLTPAQAEAYEAAA